MAINGGRKMLLQTINKFHLDQPCMLLFHEALSKVVIEFVLYGRILVCLFVWFFFHVFFNCCGRDRKREKFLLTQKLCSFDIFGCFIESNYSRIINNLQLQSYYAIELKSHSFLILKRRSRAYFRFTEEPLQM